MLRRLRLRHETEPPAADEPRDPLDLVTVTVEGVRLDLVWQCCEDWLNAEAEIVGLRQEQDARLEAMRGHGVPIQTVRAAMAILALSKDLDSSQAVLEACMKLLKPQIQVI